MVAGLIGVPLGSFVAQHFRQKYENCDPMICGLGLMTSAPLVYLALVETANNTTTCFLFVFFAQIALNLCWSIVADILLYVVIPTRRSTAEAFQILISHALGDAGSPYLVGVFSEAIKKSMRTAAHHTTNLVHDGLESLALTMENATLSTSTEPAITLSTHESDETSFKALQYALFSTSFVEVLGAVFFFITAAYIVKDKRKANQPAHAEYVVPNIEDLS